MHHLPTRLKFILAVTPFLALYLVAFLEAGWDPQTSTGIFVLVAAAMGASVATLAALGALRERLRGRSTRFHAFVGVFAVVAAAVAGGLALVGMPVESRNDTAVVYWVATAAALVLVGAGFLLARRR